MSCLLLLQGGLARRFMLHINQSAPAALFICIYDIDVSQDQRSLGLLAFERAEQRVLNVECQGNGSWELCVFKSAATSVRTHTLAVVPTARITISEGVTPAVRRRSDPRVGWLGAAVVV